MRSKLGNGNTVAMELPAGALAILERHGKVARISEDVVMTANLDVTGHALVDSYKPWAGSLAATLGSSGSGATVAVLDSGIAPVAGLANHMDRAVAVSGGAVVVKSAAWSDDPFGHGTHVAGIIGGSRMAMGGIACEGIAQGARLLPVKVLDATGSGYTSDVILAIDWCIRNKALYGISVMNLSLSHPVYESYTTDPLCQAVERAWKAGIVVVCSAGNWGRNGYGTVGSPGNDPYVITVGAMNTIGTYARADDIPATYSSKGPSFGDHILKPDIMAPGNKITSWAAPGSALYNDPNVLKFGSCQRMGYPFMQLSGTSMAAPVVSGVVALMKSLQPAATPDQIKSRLLVTAQKTRSSVFERGAGYVNPVGALASVSLRNTPALSPTVRQNADGSYKLVDTITGQGVLWGDSVMWGDAVLWGDAAYSLPPGGVLWGDTAGTLPPGGVLWGDSTIVIPPGSVLWGNTSVTNAVSVLWTDSVMWGDAVLWGDAVIGGGAAQATFGTMPTPPLPPGGVLWGDTLPSGD